MSRLSGLWMILVCIYTIVRKLCMYHNSQKPWVMLNQHANIPNVTEKTSTRTGCVREKFHRHAPTNDTQHHHASPIGEGWTSIYIFNSIDCTILIVEDSTPLRFLAILPGADQKDVRNASRCVWCFLHSGPCGSQIDQREYEHTNQVSWQNLHFLPSVKETQETNTTPNSCWTARTCFFASSGSTRSLGTSLALGHEEL